MRCIETIFDNNCVILPVRINYNMRCIETQAQTGKADWISVINYNMRCIETLFFLLV